MPDDGDQLIKCLLDCVCCVCLHLSACSACMLEQHSGEASVALHKLHTARDACGKTSKQRVADA